MRHRVTDRVTEKTEGQSIPLEHPGPPRCYAQTLGANGGARTLDLLFTNERVHSGFDGTWHDLRVVARNHKNRQTTWQGFAEVDRVADKVTAPNAEGGAR